MPRTKEPVSDYETVNRWIRPERLYPGDPDAHIVDSGIPIWALIGHCKMANGDIGLTAEDYHLPRQAVEAAWLYYQLHRDVIDARLAANELAAG